MHHWDTALRCSLTQHAHFLPPLQLTGATMIEEPEASRACVNITHQGTGPRALRRLKSLPICNPTSYVYTFTREISSCNMPPQIGCLQLLTISFSRAHPANDVCW